MTPSQYSRDALKTYSNKKPPTDPNSVQLMHAAIGLSGEAGEILDRIKKSYFYKSQPLTAEDRINLKEEVGDVLWYCNLILDGISVSWDEAFRSNLSKLAVRYPDKTFNSRRAFNRNLSAEEDALKQ